MRQTESGPGLTDGRKGGRWATTRIFSTKSRDSLHPLKKMNPLPVLPQTRDFLLLFSREVQKLGPMTVGGQLCELQVSMSS